jgi:hypothetical protein
MKISCSLLALPRRAMAGCRIRRGELALLKKNLPPTLIPPLPRPPECDTKHYPLKDYHRIYIGEIEAVLKK